MGLSALFTENCRLWIETVDESERLNQTKKLWSIKAKQEPKDTKTHSWVVILWDASDPLKFSPLLCSFNIVADYCIKQKILYCFQADIGFHLFHYVIKWIPYLPLISKGHLRLLNRRSNNNREKLFYNTGVVATTSASDGRANLYLFHRTLQLPTVGKGASSISFI